MVRTLRFRTFGLLAVIFFTMGCGGGDGPTAKITGLLVSGGKPYRIEEGQTMNLSLIGKAGKSAGKAFQATINSADGSFDFPGPKGNGIPVGTYKVNLNITTAANDQKALGSLTKINKQFEKINGKEFEVIEQPANITIDVSSGTISK